LCLEDTDYQFFRTKVRSSEWQNAFLAKPLQDRIQEARAIRAQSEARKAMQTVWADVDDQAAVDALTQHQATVLVHGHTHRPADHSLSPGLMRYVLSDWDAATSPPRLQAFTWQAGVGFSRTLLTDRA
jgi:UDP-2,3-diacylglucosamine hydrolase